MTIKSTGTIVNFFLLVFLLSVPFWVLGYFVDISEIIPIDLPISALMLFSPLIAAIILTKGENGKSKISSLLKLIFKSRKPRNRIWIIPSIFLVPILMLLTYQVMKWWDFPLPALSMQFRYVLIFTILFFIEAICEEIGWTGYITDPLIARVSAFKTALLIGCIWATWHIIPYIQAHRVPVWIFWHCMGTVALRIIMVWLYNNSGKWIWTAITCHTTINLSEFLFPNYGSHYNPFIFSMVLILATILITILWGSKTLTRNR